MTLFTAIGYGSYTPETNEGRAFAVFYGILGITIFGLFLSSLLGIGVGLGCASCC